MFTYLIKSRKYFEQCMGSSIHKVLGYFLKTEDR